MKNLNKMTDEELALAYVEGNNRAFDLLLSHVEASLFSYIRFVVRDEEKANDIFQETFVKAIMKLQKREYAPSGKFGAWCVRIAHNIIMDQYREKLSRHVVEAGEDNDLSRLGCDDVLLKNKENDLVNKQVFSDVKKMVDHLPTVQREVVYMRYYQELSFKEIAELTNVSINTSLGRMHYALRNLRKMAKDYHVCLQLD